MIRRMRPRRRRMRISRLDGRRRAWLFLSSGPRGRARWRTESSKGSSNGNRVTRSPSRPSGNARFRRPSFGRWFFQRGAGSHAISSTCCVATGEMKRRDSSGSFRRTTTRRSRLDPRSLDERSRSSTSPVPTGWD